MSKPTIITREGVDAVTFVVEEAYLDAYNAPALRTVTVALTDEARYRQIIDLRNVTSIDPTGLGVIVGARKRAQAHGGDLVLANVGQTVAHVLAVTGLGGTIRVAANVTEAIEMLEPAPACAAPEPARPAPLVLFGVAVDPALPGNGDTPIDNIRAELDLLADRIARYTIGPDADVSMPDEIAPGHVLRWSTLLALLGGADALNQDASPNSTSATQARSIAAGLLQSAARDLAREIDGEQIRTRIDDLTDSGAIPRGDYETLQALADAVRAELQAAASGDTITVTIKEN